MGVSYEKQFKPIINRDLKKDLQEMAKDEYVCLDILVKVCNTLNVNIGDIMEVLPRS